MDKTLYLESKLKYLKQEYNELVEALNKEALVARPKAELELFGAEYAPQRHLFKEYGIE